MLSGELFRLADRHASWLNVRQRTIAENVAHANTPEYISKSVSGFDAKVDGRPVSLNLTSEFHIRPNINADTAVASYKISEDSSGNPVQLENEMMTALDVRRSYELNTSIVKAFNRMILMAAKG
jgi:flagellar basal-body rod protein FlgB